MKKEKWIYEKKWLIFYFTFNFELVFSAAGYYDERPRIIIGLVFFKLTIPLPFKSKWANECDAPKWGIAIHNNTFWVYKGGKGNMNGGNKWWTWSLPFFTKEWVRTSILLKTMDWESEYPKKSKEFWRDKWKSKQASWTYDYTDKYDGEVIPTMIYVEEREWRPKWLLWTPLFAKKNRTIDVYFSKQCGKRKGSWKGGVLGCSYTMLPDEHPLDCLKRMEKERDF